MADSPLVTAAEVRAFDSSLDESLDPAIEALVTEFEGIIEDYRGCAYVERTEVVESREITGTVLSLAWRPLIELASVTIDGADYTEHTVDLNTGIVRDLTCGVVVVEYSHGVTNEREVTIAQRACKMYAALQARAELSGAGRDVIRQSNEMGGTTAYSTPDKAAKRPTGYLRPDAMLNSLPDRRRVPVA